MSPLQHETQIYQSPEKSLSLNLIHGGLVCGPLAAGLRLSEKEVERAKGEMFAELRSKEARVGFLACDLWTTVLTEDFLNVFACSYKCGFTVVLDVPGNCSLQVSHGRRSYPCLAPTLADSYCYERWLFKNTTRKSLGRAAWSNLDRENYFGQARATH